MSIQENAETGSDTGTTEATVLFVDDESAMVETYEALCDPLYDVRTAQTGEEALAEFGPHIDFAFVDRRMPDTSGEEIIQTLRERGHETPIVVLSAVDPDVELSATYDAYLTKPVGKEQIRNTVTQHLS